VTAFVVLGIIVAIAAAIRGIWSPCGLSMLTSINPLSERAKGHRYPVTAAWFLVGALLGGITLGLGSALLAIVVNLSDLTDAARLGLVGVFGLLAVLGDAGALGVEFPIIRRQVNERWLDQYRGWVYGAGFGWQIGVGFATYVMSAAVILTVLIGALGASPLLALGLGVIFGVVRGSAVLLSAQASTQASLRDLLRWLDAIEQPVRVVVMAIEAAMACIAGLLVAPWLGAVIGIAGFATVAIVASRHGELVKGR